MHNTSSYTMHICEWTLGESALFVTCATKMGKCINCQTVNELTLHFVSVRTLCCVCFIAHVPGIHWLIHSQRELSVCVFSLSRVVSRVYSHLAIYSIQTCSNMWVNSSHSKYIYLFIFFMSLFANLSRQKHL